MRICGRTLGVLLVASSAALLAQAPAAPAQAPAGREQFRTGVELLQLDVAVLDGKRQPIRGLAAGDFTVLDNGVATPIRAFTPVELAPGTRTGEAAWSKDVAPDVVTNTIGQQDGRLVMILLDRSIKAHESTVTAKKIASSIVDALGPGDLAAVISTSHMKVQNLTADHALLLRAINSGDPATGISPDAEVIMGKLDPLQDGRCLCGVCVLQTIERVADAVQSTPRRRKVLFFIGSDVVWQSSRPVAQAGADVGCEVPLKDARAAMFAAVDRANLQVHSIDPQGLVNLGPQTMGGARGGFDRPVNSGPTERLRQQQTAINDSISGRQNLDVLPARTGGRTIVGKNNPEEDVPSLFRESEAYYVLGIERGVSDPPDRARSIEVKVARKGVTVVAQRKYLGPSAGNGATSAAGVQGASPSDVDVLSRLLPTASVPLALNVTPFASPSGATPVVRINVDAGAFARQDGAEVPLDVAVVATDQTGKSIGSARQHSTITATRAASGAPPSVNLQSHLELPPGDYGIRVAVTDPASSRLATVFSDVTVPKFASAPLSVSGLSVEVANGSSPAPTTRRTFGRREQVRAVLQIYQGTERADPIAPVAMRVQILDAKGSAVRDQTLPFGEQTFTNRRADCVITLPLAALAPGDYLLKLEASANRQTSGRAVRFTVE